jgi:hypothetical protein
MTIMRRFTVTCAALCLVSASGCIGARTQLDYVREMLPATVATQILGLEQSSDFPEELALSYLTQTINATRYGIALSNTGNRGKRTFDFADVHVSLLEQTTQSLTRKETIYILELKNFCGRRAVMIGTGSAFTSTYTYSREADARTTAAALLALGANPCDRGHAPDDAAEPPQDQALPDEST